MNFDSSVLQVAVEDIIPNRFQPRLVFEDDSLQELSNSIKQHGIIQPLVLRKVGDKYEIIAGERRYKAATMAGLASVPAVISQADDKTSAEAAVVENVQRKDLSAIEEAKSYKALLDQGYMSQDQLAKKMGLSQSAVANKLRLLTLPEEIQTAVMENKISERHARSLLKLKSADEQISFMQRVINERLTVRQLDEIIKEAHPAGVQNVNIEEVRETAEDIKPVEVEAPIEEPKKEEPFKMGAINLGQRQQNRFFNNLEDEAANMQMTEAINPFDSFENNESPFATTTGVDTQVNKAEEIEEQQNITFASTDEQVLGGTIDVIDNPEQTDESNGNKEIELSPIQESTEPQDIFPKDPSSTPTETQNGNRFINSSLIESNEVTPNDIPKIDEGVSAPETPVENPFGNLMNNPAPTEPIVEEQKEEIKPEEPQEIIQPVTANAINPLGSPEINPFAGGETKTDMVAAPVVEASEMTKMDPPTATENPIDLISEAVLEQTGSIPIVSPDMNIENNNQIPGEEIEMLDSLDFEPPKKEIDITPAIDKINSVVNALKQENFNVESIKTDLADQVTFTITIKKED